MLDRRSLDGQRRGPSSSSAASALAGARHPGRAGAAPRAPAGPRDRAVHPGVAAGLRSRASPAAPCGPSSSWPSSHACDCGAGRPSTHVALLPLALTARADGRADGGHRRHHRCLHGGRRASRTRCPWFARAGTDPSYCATLGGRDDRCALGAALILSRPTGRQRVPPARPSRLSGSPRGTVVCTEYEAGSWLLWMHPGLVPTVDGRTEIYPPSQLRAARALANGSPAAGGSISESSGCRYALVRTGGASARLLSERNRLLEANGELSLYSWPQVGCKFTVLTCTRSGAEALAMRIPRASRRAGSWLMTETARCGC